MRNDSARVWGWRFGICFVCSLQAAAGSAQTAPAGDAQAKQFVSDYVKAWNAGDTDALGRMWTADGELIDAQGAAVDRKALLANRQAAGKGTRPVLSITLDKVRLLDPNVAQVEGESKLATPQAEVVQQTRFSGALVKQDGSWRIRFIRQLSQRQPPKAPPAEPLKELSWLVGEWVGVGDGMRVHTSAQWDLGNRYIVSRSEFEPQTGDAYDADVRIGWDPESHALKSWYFDSRGVSSTTLWEKNDDHWLGKISGCQSDGESFTGTMAITQIDNDSYLRTLSNMKVGSQALPNQELRMFRVPEQPAE